jgi:hypothetical protein
VAILRLRAPLEWGYDQTTGEIVLKIRTRATETDPNRADWVPDKEAIVRLTPTSIQVNNL